MALARLTKILPDERRAAAAAYILSWIAAAALASVSIAVFSARGTSDAGELALFVLVTAGADAVVINLHHGRSSEFLSLLEAAICMNLLLFPGSVALAVTVGGSAIGQLIHRRHPVKAIFNLSQYAVGVGIAIMVLHVLGAEPGRIDLKVAAAVALGMTCFGTVNSVAVSGIVAMFEDRPFAKTLREGLPFSMLTVLANAAVGVLATAVWLSEPSLTILFLVPAAALHLAYRGVIRTQQLLEDVMEERDRLNRIVVGASDGIVLLDGDDTIGVWSPAMTEMIGVPAEDALGATLPSILPGKDLDGREIDLVERMRAATPLHPTTSIDMVVGHRKGGDRIVTIRHNALFDAELKGIGHALVIHDVTREHESNRLKEDFLARVSHELRTPLTPIKGYAETLLRRQGKLSEQVQSKALESIVERVDHMKYLIDDLLLVSRTAGGQASLSDQIRLSTVDVAEVVLRVATSFRGGEPERAIELQVVGAPPAALADPARLEQIVKNLLSNACKYSEPETPVKIYIRAHEDSASLEVVDKGRGIAPDQLDSVFDRFFRVEDPLTMSTGGMGLGLYIARELARVMDGNLTVSSELGKGSTFTLRLPLAPAGSDGYATPS